MEGKWNWKRWMAVFLSFMLAISVLPGGAAEAATKKYVKKLTLSKSSVAVTAGAAKSVTATVKVSGKANTAVKASSSDKAVATVKVSGKKVTVTGKKAGTATVTVMTDRRGGQDTAGGFRPLCCRDGGGVPHCR